MQVNYCFAGLCILTAVSSSAFADGPPDQEEIGLVYYIGSVEAVIQGRATIDLGDAHDVRIGSKLAIFKAKDSYFEPVGIATAAECFPTWTMTAREQGIRFETGQMVIQIRSVAELSTEDRIRDKFLSHQKILGSQRNGYTSMRRLETASALMNIQKQQPKWVSGRRRIAGIVTSESQSGPLPARVKNLLNQINQFRRMEEQNLPASEAAGKDWQTVMSILKDRPVTSLDLVTSEAAVVETVVEESADPVIPVANVQKIVKETMFQRNRQEQALAAAYVIGLLRSGDVNEDHWIDRETKVSMFPQLSSDAPFKIEVLAVVKKLLESQE